MTVNQGSFSDGQQVYAYVVDSAGTPNATGYGPLTIQSAGAPDTAAPTCSTLAAAPTSQSLTVPITSWDCADNVGVTGWYLSESPNAPGSTGWLSQKPTSFVVGGTGTRTIYAWARDAAGNISTPINATVTVTLAGAVQFTNRAGKSSTFTQGTGQVRFTQ